MLAADVRALLDDYAPIDARESLFRDRMLSLTEHPYPFARSTFVPGHFTASAFVLSPDRSALALIFHRKLRLWLQPGGHIESSDASVPAAARREVEEELGFVALPSTAGDLFDIDIHRIPGRADEPEHEHFDLRVLLVAPNVHLHPSEEVEGARWVPLDDIARFVTDESVARAARKLGRGPAIP